MDVWRITVAALRRWYILLPLLALTGYATITVGDGVRPQYEVTATAILVPGTTSTDIAGPYGGISGTTEVLAIILNNTASRDHIEGLGLNPDYVTAARTRSTIIDVSVLSDTAEESLATTEAVLELARHELSERQEAVGIPSSAQVSLQVLQAPSLSNVVSDGKLRNMAIVGIVGAALSLLLAVLFDDIVGLIRRWVGKRRDRASARRHVGVTAAREADSDAAADAPATDDRNENSTNRAASSEARESNTPSGSRSRSSRDLAQAGRDG